MPARIRTQRVCFTLNGWTGEEEGALHAWLDARLEEGKLIYAIVGRELSTTGTTHLQGYINLNPKHYKCPTCTLSFWKGVDGLGRAHFEASKGTAADNRR